MKYGSRVVHVDQKLTSPLAASLRSDPLDREAGTQADEMILAVSPFGRHPRAARGHDGHRASVGPDDGRVDPRRETRVSATSEPCLAGCRFRASVSRVPARTLETPRRTTVVRADVRQRAGRRKRRPPTVLCRARGAARAFSRASSVEEDFRRTSEGSKDPRAQTGYSPCRIPWGQGRDQQTEIEPTKEFEEGNTS